MEIVRAWSGCVAVVGVLAAMALPARAATFTVNSTADQVDATPGDGACATATGLCTLRAAVQEANALPGGDIISLPAGTFRLAPTGAGEDAAKTGDLDVTEALAVAGAGIDQTVIDGSGADRIFDVLGATAFSLANLTLRRGSAGGGNGGAVQHVGPAPLTLANVRLERNHAGTGAAIYHAGGVLTVSGSTFADNVSGYSGGGIYKSGPGTLSVDGSTFTGNVGGGPGGAIAFDGPEGVAIANTGFVSSAGGGGGAVWVNAASSLAIAGCRFEDSQSYGNGGGVSYTGPGGTTVSGTTFTGGVAAGVGGGLYVDAQVGLDVSGSTFDQNAAGNAGGGLYFNSGAGELTLRDGSFTLNGAYGGSGGAFYVNVTQPVTLANLEVRGNSSVNGGGGGLVYAPQGAAISGVRCLDNVTTANAGGGLYVNAGDASTITSATFSGNRVDDGDGGGLYLVGNGPYDVEACTFATNLAAGTDAQGGGLFVASGQQSQILNDTFSGNQSAYRGGGLFGGSDVTVYSATFAGNAAGQGGGLYNGSVLRIGNSILAAGPGGGNCDGNAFDSGNRSIDTDGTCKLDGPSDRVGIDPQLGPLADNGGPTQTHAIAATSPAVDSGNPTACPPIDQRGIARPVDGDGDGTARCDVGAYEYFDQCPGDPRKVDPGVCGCGTPDADDNANGVVDCLLNAELKARIARARALLAGLAPDRSATQKSLRGELKKVAADLVAYATQHRQGIVLTDPHANLTKLAKVAAKSLKGALRARGHKLERARPRAGAALDRLDGPVAPQ